MRLKPFVVALSLAGLALSAAPASAWWLMRKHGINRYSTVVVCRPYNAFTPVCSGSLVCDGCCPFSCPQMPSGAACSPLLGNPMLGMCYNPAGMAGMAQAPQMGYGQPMGYGPAMAMPGQQFQAPMPAPMPPQQQTYMPMPYQVQPANYQQGYYPVYYPIYPDPMTINPYQQVPSYWYGN